MTKVIYSMGVSLDGFIAGPAGEFDWSAPDEELHRFHNLQMQEIGAHLCGRRLYEEMVYWETADANPAAPEHVLEFARILGSGQRPRRTVYFGLFGCEEEGELGAQYVMAHPPMALTDLIANLEFEMIGVDDPQRPGALMLTG